MLIRSAKIITMAKLSKLIIPEGKNFNVLANLQVKNASRIKDKIRETQLPHLFLLSIAHEEIINKIPNTVPLISEGKLCVLR